MIHGRLGARLHGGNERRTAQPADKRLDLHERMIRNAEPPVPGWTTKLSREGEPARSLRTSV